MQSNDLSLKSSHGNMTFLSKSAVVKKQNFKNEKKKVNMCVVNLMEPATDLQNVQVLSCERLSNCMKKLKKKRSQLQKKISSEKRSPCRKTHSCEKKSQCSRPSSCHKPPHCQRSFPTVKGVPGQLCDILAKLVAYLCEVVKLMASEPDTRVADTLLDLYDVVAVLGNDLYCFVKDVLCRYYYKLKCCYKRKCK